MKRREVIKSSFIGTGALFLSEFSGNRIIYDTHALKNNINHSVCQWTYNHINIEELCVLVKKIGFAAIDLVGPKDWPILK